MLTRQKWWSVPKKLERFGNMVSSLKSFAENLLAIISFSAIFARSRCIKNVVLLKADWSWMLSSNIGRAYVRKQTQYRSVKAKNYPEMSRDCGEVFLFNDLIGARQCANRQCKPNKNK